MQIRTDKLRKTLVLLQTVVPKKSALAVIQNVRCMDGQITGTDLETAVSIDIPEIGGDAFLLPYRKTIECLKYVPGDLMITIESGDKSVKLFWDGGSAAFMVPLTQDFPKLEVNDPVSEADLDGDRLLNAMASALVYAATEKERPILTGVALYLGETIQVAAADGFRMSFEALKVGYPEATTIIVSAGTINTLSHLWHMQPGQPSLGNSLVSQLCASRPLNFGISPGNLRVKFGNITVSAKLIEGAFPDVLATLANFKEESKLTIMAPEFRNAVRRLKDIAKSSSGIVRLQWTDSTLSISAESADVGSISAVIPVKVEGVPGRIAISLNYLNEYLSGKDGFITMGTVNRESPAVFHFGNRPLVAVMPMKAAWDDDPQPDPLKVEDVQEPATEGATETKDSTEETEATEEETEATTEETAQEETTVEAPAQVPEPVAAAEGPEPEL